MLASCSTNVSRRSESCRIASSFAGRLGAVQRKLTIVQLGLDGRHAITFDHCVEVRF